MRLFLSITMLIPLVSFGQEDSLALRNDTLDIKQITVVSEWRLRTYEIIKEEQIRELQPNDVGELVQKIPGFSLRSYGGLGGLKTATVRGLGAGFNAIVVDGFSLPNVQTGQVNLGQLKADNIVRLSFSGDESWNIYAPVGAIVQGNSLMIKTFEGEHSQESVSARANVGMGSFGRYEGFGAIKVSRKRWYASISADGRLADGEYPFKFQNGQTLISETRTNNQYSDGGMRGNLGIRTNKSGHFRLGYARQGIEQALPGAMILYNSTSDELLETRLNRAFVDGYMSIRRWKTRIYGLHQSRNVLYTDPTYLNQQGFLQQQYVTRMSELGGVTIRTLQKWWFSAGVQGRTTKLSGSEDQLGTPIRKHGIVLARLRFVGRIWQYGVKASGQYINEWNTNDSKRDYLAFNPEVSIRNKINSATGSRHWRHVLLYKRSFRLPSFNELYFGTIGNTNLRPERADQLRYQLSVVPVERKLDLDIRTSMYANLVSDKIVAIPTQNLFVWSIQNIDRVGILGGDAEVFFEYPSNRHTRKWWFKANANYSFQYAVDITDAEEPTYGHQVAYIPQHSGNADFSLHHDKVGLRLSNMFVSHRYALNENTSFNLVKGFHLMDATVFGTFKLKSMKLTLRATVKNILNTQYAYIRSYPMPGRNFLISLQYAFH